QSMPSLPTAPPKNQPPAAPSILFPRNEKESPPRRQRPVGERLLAVFGRLQHVVADKIEQPPHFAAGHFELRHEGAGERTVDAAFYAVLRDLAVLCGIHDQRSRLRLRRRRQA